MAPPAVDTVWRGARRLVTDPRTVGLAEAVPRTVAFMARSWAQGRRPAPPGEPARLPATLGLAAQVLLDEVVISAMRNPRLFPDTEDYRRAGEDIRQALALWRDRGWLDDPDSFHRAPRPPDRWFLHRGAVWNQRFERLTFPSRYTPHAREPGRDRWLAHGPNRTAHAHVVRHREPGRPWLVCIHGFGMGRPAVDLLAFRARHLHEGLGLNLLFPVLPLHGARQDPGADAGEGLMTIDLIDTVHGLAQAAWDVRSAVAWIRATAGDAPVGLYGISLGAYVASLVASLEPGLACVIAGVPAADMPALYRRHSTPDVRRKAFAAGALGPDADSVVSVVSPLVLAPKLPRERRYVFGGVGDRMSTPTQAKRLWAHWGRPKLAWYPGGHLGFWWAGAVGRFVTAALAESGLAVDPAPPADALPA